MLTEAELNERLLKIRMLLLDLDGVLTEGGITMDGEREIKTFSARDGVGIKYLQRNGVEVAIITGRRGDAASQRARDLGIEELHMFALKKWPVVQEILKRRNFKIEEMAYIGDDLVDLPIMLRVGLGLAVADTAPEVIAHCHAVLGKPGGRGAVREAAEMILRAQGKWDAVVQSYLSLDEPEPQNPSSPQGPN